MIRKKLFSLIAGNKSTIQNREIDKLVDELSEDYFMGFLPQGPNPCSTEMNVNKIQDYEQQNEVRSCYSKHK